MEYIPQDESVLSLKPKHILVEAHSKIRLEIKHFQKKIISVATYFENY